MIPTPHVDKKIVECTLSNWGHTRIIDQLSGGYRNLAWRIELNGTPRVAKTTRRTESAIQWLSSVHDGAEAAGFVIPRLVPAKDGHLVVNGLTVETYIEGMPARAVDLAGISERIALFHKQTADLPQRPTFASSLELLDQDKGGDVDLASMPADLAMDCRHAWQILGGQPQSVVHGDLNPSNVLVTPSGDIALLDWDEARVDVSLFDRLAIGEQERFLIEEQRALLAWEIAVCWQIERDYAQGLAEDFMRTNR